MKQWNSALSFNIFRMPIFSSRSVFQNVDYRYHTWVIKISLACKRNSTLNYHSPKSYFFFFRLKRYSRTLIIVNHIRIYLAIHVHANYRILQRVIVRLEHEQWTTTLFPFSIHTMNSKDNYRIMLRCLHYIIQDIIIYFFSLLLASVPIVVPRSQMTTDDPHT